MWLKSEAATRGILLKKVFLKISQNLQENTRARVCFLIKLQGSRLLSYHEFNAMLHNTSNQNL